MMNGSCPVVQKAVTGNPYMAKEPMNLFIFGGHASEEIGKITKKRLGGRLKVATFFHGETHWYSAPSFVHPR
jgi:hypothetical protein